MANTKIYDHDLDIAGNSIKNFILNPVTTSQKNAIAATLGSSDKGFVIYDTTINAMFLWNGTIFIPALTNETQFLTWLSTEPFTGYATEAWVSARGYLTSVTETDPVFTAWLGTGPFAPYATQSWVISRGYLTAYTETDPVFAAWLNTDPFFGYATESWVTGRNYLTSYTETDPVYTASSWHGTVNNSAQWNLAYGWGNHASAGYIKTFSETDPTVPSHVKNISTTSISHWDLAYGWGNHALAGYLTSFSETDPSVPSYIKAISAAQISHWDTAYGWGDHALAGYLTSFTETDPTVPSYVKAITATQISHWDTAYGWGNHAAVGYLTSFTETDPTVPSYVKAITALQIPHWDTAYGWGNHAAAGYLTSFTETDPTVPSYVKSIGSGQIANWNTAYGWGNHAAAGYLTSVADATTTTKGLVQLAGDLGGTAALPTVPGLANKADKATTLTINGTAFDLSANRSWTIPTASDATTTSKGLVQLAGDLAGTAALPTVPGLALKVTANGAITGATFTKITYDAKGLVTGGVAATTADITDSANRRYVTDAQLARLGTEVLANAAITGATKTKITYDTKGLVTAGADATTADIADSLNRRYVTDAQLLTVNGWVIASGKTGTLNNSLTLSGTDATVMTFPSTSATIARTDAPQTFVSTQTFGNVILAGTIIAGASAALSLYHRGDIAIGIGILPNNVSVATSGNRNVVQLNDNFSPASGTATVTALTIVPLINQTGGANGITTGLRLAPTLTAAADWRSFQWDNTTHWGLYGNGSAHNYINGRLLLGSSTDNNTDQLQVTGSLLTTTFKQSGAGALSAPAIQGTGSWIGTGGTSTTTKPYMLIEPAGATSTGWSTLGTGLGVNAATGFTGNLVDFQLAGVSKAYVTYTGVLVVPFITSSNIRPSGASALLLGYNSGTNYPTAGTYLIDGAAGTMTMTSGNNGGLYIHPTYNQVSSTAANTDLLINRTETSIGSGAQYLIDAQVGGVSKFSVDRTGATVIGTTFRFPSVGTMQWGASFAQGLLSWNTGYAMISAQGSNDLMFATSTGTERMRLLAATGNLGIGTAAPAATALMDVSSTTKGVLFPRMTTAQRTSIASPANGLMVYDTDLNKLHVYESSAWVIAGTGTASDATTSAKGIVQLAGDLAGTAALPTVPGLALKVTANAAITGATFTKITYDTKGLVTEGVAATTADIADSTNRRYLTDAQLAALSTAVVANAAITGATKTKITYDTKGLVTVGTDATTADIVDSTNRRYLTDAQLAALGVDATASVKGLIQLAGDLAGTAASPTVPGLALKVTANTTITPGTFTKITYDAKGLVTAGAAATTADFTDSTDKRYITDAQLTTLTYLNTAIGTPAATSASFELQGTTKGALLPRLTTTQKTAISSPANGLMVYDTDLSKLAVYENTGWATPLSGRRVLVSNVQLSNTGSTTENVIFTGTIPGGSLGVNGSFHINSVWSRTNSANVITMRIRFNGTAVVTYQLVASNASCSTYSIIRNRNSLTAQISGPSNATGNVTFNNGSNAVPTASAFNTAADITVTVSATNAVGTDTAALEGFEIIAYF